MKKPRSEFLQPPGSSPEDRYGEDSDWYELPAWRKTTFFGIRARGQFFVYVVDCSGSMLDDDRLTRATIEVRRSVLSLVEPQKFEVIFYNEESMPMPGGPRARTADLQAKNQLMSWLRVIEPDGGTDPRLAIKQAISLKPDAVFLLSDGEFPEGTVDQVAKLNSRKIPIHCIDLAGGLAGDHLKRIAASSGGRYASRPGSLQVAPPSRIDRP
jgi:von Willebrand factor type A domain